MMTSWYYILSYYETGNQLLMDISNCTAGIRPFFSNTSSKCPVCGLPVFGHTHSSHPEGGMESNCGRMARPQVKNLAGKFTLPANDRALIQLSPLLFCTRTISFQDATPAIPAFVSIQHGWAFPLFQVWHQNINRHISTRRSFPFQIAPSNPIRLLEME